MNIPSKQTRMGSPNEKLGEERRENDNFFRQLRIQILSDPTELLW